MQFRYCRAMVDQEQFFKFSRHQNNSLINQKLNMVQSTIIIS